MSSIKSSFPLPCSFQMPLYHFLIFSAFLLLNVLYQILFSSALLLPNAPLSLSHFLCFPPSNSPLPSTLRPRLLAAKQRVDIARGGLGPPALRQLVAPDRRGRHGPEVAAVVAEGVFQKQRVRVEHLCLNLLERERLRLREGGVARAGLPDLRLDLLVLGRQRVNLLRDGGRLRPAIRGAQELRLLTGLLVELLPQRALAFEQSRVNALPYVRARLRQQFEQASRALALARLQRPAVVARP